jgi:hypothetical protein
MKMRLSALERIPASTEGRHCRIVDQRTRWISAGRFLRLNGDDQRKATAARTIEATKNLWRIGIMSSRGLTRPGHRYPAL